MNTPQPASEPVRRFAAKWRERELRLFRRVRRGMASLAASSLVLLAVLYWSDGATGALGGALLLAGLLGVPAAYAWAYLSAHRAGLCLDPRVRWQLELRENTLHIDDAEHVVAIALTDVVTARYVRDAAGANLHRMTDTLVLTLNGGVSVKLPGRSIGFSDVLSDLEFCGLVQHDAFKSQVGPSFDAKRAAATLRVRAPMMAADGKRVVKVHVKRAMRRLNEVTGRHAMPLAAVISDAHPVPITAEIKRP